MVSRSMTQVGKWTQRIVGGTPVLALASLSGPATTSTVINIGEEVIEVEGEAPWNPSMGMGGHTGTGAPNYYPSGGDSGGGGGGVPSEDSACSADTG